MFTAPSPGESTNFEKRRALSTTYRLDKRSKLSTHRANLKLTIRYTGSIKLRRQRVMFTAQCQGKRNRRNWRIFPFTAFSAGLCI